MLTLGSSFMTGPWGEGGSGTVEDGGVGSWGVSKACHPWKAPLALLLVLTSGAGVVDTPGSSKVDHPSSCGC